MVEKELRVSKIKDGTVIDHITAGYALAVLRIIGLTGREGNIISILMNVPSQKLGKKDIVKVENRELKEDEVHKIALIAPNATINIIRNYEVVEKNKVKLPKIIKGVIKCANSTCITNSGEPVQPTFIVESVEPLKLRCHYCRIVMTREDIIKQF
jgi:aspartate carbamoyltransferase regulatory subunit